MGNLVATNVQLSGSVSDINSFLKKYVESLKDGRFFEHAVPMPETLRLSSIDYAREDLVDVCKDFSEQKDTSYLLYFGAPKCKQHWDVWNEMRVKNLELYGSKDWADWCDIFWGTQKEAFDIAMDIQEDVVDLFFFTANSHCLPVVNVLANEFKGICFDVAFSDEAQEEFSGLYLINRSLNIDTSLVPKSISDGFQYKKEILNRTWGEDVFRY